MGTDPENSLEKEGIAYLDDQDKKYGKNKDVLSEPQTQEEPPNLGKARTPMLGSTIHGANDSHWKNIPLENLPSRGLFYPNGTEITIKAAQLYEIRQWSTIDENDKLNVDDSLNFIIEKCCRISVRNGGFRLTWRDISELDRLALIFMIQEITFPDNQNSLYAKFACPGPCVDKDRWRDEVQIKSHMLTFIDFPQEIMEYYSEKNKCFEIVSDKLNETFYIYMPTIGAVEKLRARILQAKADGKKIDKAFIPIAPYLIQDWQSFNQEAYYRLASDNYGWHINKFTFVTKFVKLLEGARNSMVQVSCPRCGVPISTPLFSKSGFTVKDLFFISGGLNELI